MRRGRTRAFRDTCAPNGRGARPLYPGANRQLARVVKQVGARRGAVDRDHPHHLGRRLVARARRHVPIRRSSPASKPWPCRARISGYRGDLSVGVCAGIFRVRDQPLDPPALDLVGRPRPLISGGLSRAGARTRRRRGSVGLLGVPDPAPSSGESDDTENRHEDDEWNACPCCGGRMIIIETFEPGCRPRQWPIPSSGLDSS